MKTIPKILVSLSLPILCAATAFGQAYTTPVGATVQTLASGAAPLSFTFQHPKLFQGAVSGATGAVITVDVSEISAQLLTVPHLVQVVSGPATGKVATIIDTNGSSITTDPAISGLVATDTIAIRKHFTLGDIQTTPELVDSTTISIYNASGALEVYEYFSSSTLGTPTGLWADSEGIDATNTAIFPGEGVVFNNAGAAVELTQLGTVSVDPVEVSVGPSFSLVGSLNPVSTSTIGEVFGSLPVGSTLTAYSSDGSFTQIEAYEQFDLAELGMGTGTVFGNLLGEDATNDTISASSALVVNPSSSTAIVVPAAFSSN
jgi:hypothetical protein